MGLIQAIKTCLIKSFQTSGRAARAEYWLFLLPGLALSVAAFAVLRACFPTLTTLQTLLFSIPGLLPLAAVTARRLADCGQSPDDIFMPTGALILFLTGLVALEAAFAWIESTLTRIDGPSVIFLVLTLAPFLLTLFAAIAVVFFAGITAGASLFGHMALPSQSGPNRYGPNPLEVTP